MQESLISYTVIVTEPHSSGSLTLQMGNSQAGQPGVVQVSERTDEGNLLVYSNARNTAVPKPPIPSSSHLCLQHSSLNQVKLISKGGDSSLSDFTAIVNLCPPCA